MPSSRTFVRFAIAAVIVTALALLAFFGLRNYFHSQFIEVVKLATHDSAKAIEDGESVNVVFKGTTIDLSTQLSPFLLVVDQANIVVGSAAQIDGNQPELPAELYEAARKAKTSQTIWAPKPELEFTLFAYDAGEGRVVAGGRSTKPFRGQIRTLTIWVVIGWAAALVIAFLWAWRTGTPAAAGASSKDESLVPDDPSDPDA